MTETVTDASSLYEVDADFRSMLALWDEHRRCPLPLVDYLLDRGLERQAEACRWAATEPDRPVWSFCDRATGPFPTTSTGHVYWCWRSEGDPVRHANEVEDNRLTEKGYRPDTNEVVYNLLYLLDNWK